MSLLFIQDWIRDEVIRAVGWTFIHSLWQGLVAAGVAGIIIISTRRSAARLRYNLLGLVMITSLVIAVFTFYQQFSIQQVSGQAITYSDITPDNGSYLTDEQIAVSATGFIGTFKNYFNTHANFFVGCWLVFFLFHCLKLITGLAGISRLSHRHTVNVSENWQRTLDQLCRTLQVKRSIRLLQSELVKVPVAIGFLKPVVLVPAGLLAQLPADQVETILLHELAHIRRNDYFVNVLQRFTEAIFFFNPALRWISSLVRQEREACCDDVVMANTTSKGSYLEALVSFQEYSLASSNYAMAIGTNQHYLLNRVKRMLTRENKKLNLMEKLALLLGLIVVTAFSFIPQQEKSNIKKESTSLIVEKEPISLQRSFSVAASPAKIVSTPIRKERKKSVALAMTIIDTIPAAEKKVDRSELKFPSISSTVDDDGKTRKETTIATDQHGKKYNITRNNGVVTSLSLDGVSVPENEIKNYSDLLDKIEGSMGQRRLMQTRESEDRNQNEFLRGEQSRLLREKQQLRLAESRIQLKEREQERKQYNLERTQKRENQQRKFEEDMKKMERRKVEINERIKELSTDQQKNRQRIERETQKRIELQERIERTRKIQLEKKITTSPTKLQIDPVFKYDMKAKFDIAQKFDISTTPIKKFDVHTKYVTQNKFDLQYKTSVQPKFDTKFKTFEPAAPPAKEASDTESSPSHKPTAPKKIQTPGLKPNKDLPVLNKKIFKTS